jgi:hypothetical protein
MTIWRMLIAFWIPEATKVHTQSVKYLLLFQCNNSCTNAPQVLRYKYVACLVAVNLARFAMNMKTLS